MQQNHAPSENLLSSPLTLPSGEILQNRLAKAAMSETLATYDNHATAELVTLYERWAGSGAGLIITGNVMVGGNEKGINSRARSLFSGLR